jgi:imidazolonepropionase-like amidohydrolase
MTLNAPPTRQLITADRVFDGRGTTTVDAGVVIDGDRIAAAGPRRELLARFGDTVPTESFAGCTLLPGLIDTHTHLIMPGTGIGIMEYASTPDELMLLTAAQNAALALRAGVTTVVDLGAKGALTFRLRDAIQRGIIPGPRLVLCGQALTITGGHGWPWQGEADGIDGVRQAVRALCKAGADLIKVMVTGGGTPGTDGRRPAYSQAELNTIVEEAHARDRHVVGHCTATAGIERALNAGFDVIVHCQFLTPDGGDTFDEPLARRIAAQGVFVNPTLQINRVLMSDRVPPERRAGLEPWTARYPRFAGNVRRLHDFGVRLICGSDCGWGYSTFDETYLELDAMVEAGLSPIEALISATGAAADALGRGHEIGSIDADYAADLLIVEDDPTINILALREPRAVWSAGRRVQPCRSGAMTRWNQSGTVFR